MEGEMFFESISKETEAEVDAFIANNPNKLVSYRVWRESLSLILKVYEELHKSTEEYGKRFDEILAPYHNKEITYFDERRINEKLSKIGVIRNDEIYNKIKKLNEYHYLSDIQK